MKSKINITIDEKLLERVRELAKAENRSLSNMIENLLLEVVSNK